MWPLTQKGRAHSYLSNKYKLNIFHGLSIVPCAWMGWGQL